MKNVKLLGACCNYGQRRYGPKLAPYYVEDTLRVPVEKVREVPNTNVFDYDLLYQLHRTRSKDNHVVTIGGDHSIAYSTISSSLQTYRDSLHVIWIDAHTDIHTQSTSISKNLHGMPVGHLMGLEQHPIVKLQDVKLDASQITYIGIRDIDSAEQDRLTSYNIDIGMEKLSKNIKNKNVYISLDLDSIDPVVFPCTGTPVGDGLQLSDVLSILTLVGDQSVGMDIVEFDPLIRKDTVHTCLDHINTIMDKYYSLF